MPGYRSLFMLQFKRSWFLFQALDWWVMWGKQWTEVKVHMFYFAANKYNYRNRKWITSVSGAACPHNPHPRFEWLNIFIGKHSLSRVYYDQMLETGVLCNTETRKMEHDWECWYFLFSCIVLIHCKPTTCLWQLSDKKGTGFLYSCSLPGKFKMMGINCDGI